MATPSSGPVRSRRGCGTCKARRKKCDESFDDEGSCQRCKIGKFSCTMVSTRPSRAGVSRGSSAATSPSYHHPASPSLSSLHLYPSLYPAAPHAFPEASTSTLSFPPTPAVLPHLQQLGLPQLPQLPPPPASSALSSASPFLPDPSFALFEDELAGVVEGQPLNDFLDALDGQSGGTSGAVGGLGWELALTAASQPEDSMAEIREFSKTWFSFYNSLNESFFSSIPRPVRQVIHKEMEVLVGGNDLGMAAASFLSAFENSTLLRNEGAGEEQNLEWELRTGRFYQQALLLLYDRSFSLGVRLGAITDLRMAQITRNGATASYFLLLIGEYFVKESLGPNPILDLTTSVAPSQLAIRMFAYADVLRTMCIRGRPTTFELIATPNASPDSPDGLTSRSISVHLGLPAGLLICLAVTSNLVCCESVLSVEEVKERGAAIERDILAWRPEVEKDDVLDSAQYVSDIATQELWRHVAIIYLYQTLFRVGSLHKTLRKALQQIIQLSRSLILPSSSTPSTYLNASRACPWFLAATIAVTPEDRRACREGLSDCGVGKVYRDNLTFVERFWRRTDEEGVVPTWREMVELEGMAVAFL